MEKNLSYELKRIVNIMNKPKEIKKLVTKIKSSSELLEIKEEHYKLILITLSFDYAYDDYTLTDEIKGSYINKIQKIKIKGKELCINYLNNSKIAEDIIKIAHIYFKDSKLLAFYMYIAYNKLFNILAKNPQKISQSKELLKLFSEEVTEQNVIKNIKESNNYQLQKTNSLSPTDLKSVSNSHQAFKNIKSSNSVHILDEYGQFKHEYNVDSHSRSLYFLCTGQRNGDLEKANFIKYQKNYYENNIISIIEGLNVQFWLGKSLNTKQYLSLDKFISSMKSTVNIYIASVTDKENYYYYFNDGECISKKQALNYLEKQIAKEIPSSRKNEQ